MKLIPTDKNGEVIVFLPETEEGLDTITPPLGTLAIAGYLESKNIPILHIDQRVTKNSKEIIMNCIRKGALCISMGFGTGPQIKYVIELSNAIKKDFPNFPIIWAGWHPSILIRQTLEHDSVDIIVKGQGEVTTYEIIKCIRNGTNYKDLHGIAYKENGEIFNNPDRKLEDLNNMPPMAYHLIDFKNYPGPPNRRSSPEDLFSNFRSSQGCPWRCAYCADPLVFNRRWTSLTPERTVDELENLSKKYGITYVDFVDDTFIVNKKTTIAFAKEMIKRKIKIKWSANVRTGSIVRLTDEELQLLKQAGCDLLHAGVESTTQEMLNYIDKDEKNENTLLAAQKLKKVGIAGLYGFMVSFPDEPNDMVKTTFKMVRDLKKLNPNNIMPVNFFVPYPGNVLYERSKLKGFIPPNKLLEWADFGTRIGMATPWLTKDVRDEVMKLDKYLLPSAYPSRLLKYRMKNSKIGFLYKILSKIANYRMEHQFFKYPLEWKLIYAYWKFWEKWKRKIRLPNLLFR